MNANATILNANHPSVTALSLAPVGRVVSLLATWHRRASDRARLRSLDAHLLRDVGLSRGDIEVEVSKPFWRG